MKKFPRWLKISVYFLMLLILVEVVLRYLVGLGDLPVYREDSSYEYFYESNQDVWRYGNHIVTNELGMRSKPINRKKRIKILLFGDSVLNGGAHIDQDELATTTMEDFLNRKFRNEVQLLNISAQSWGPSNAFAFLKKHGNFNSKIIVLVFSSHDWNDNMHFRKVVGNHPAWPSSKPALAITDAWSRSVWPAVKRFFSGEKEYDYLIDFDDSKSNPGWKEFQEYCNLNNLELIVYLHASKTEINNGRYNKQGKSIIRYCRQNKLILIQDLKAFTDVETAFKDDMHLISEGHHIMASLLEPVIQKAIVQKYPEFLIK